MYSDFDIDPDDSLYDPIYELYYTAANADQVLDENGVLVRNPRIRPTEDFRIPYEFVSAQGDSGGPIVIGDEVVALTSFGTVGSLFGSTSGDVIPGHWEEWISEVIETEGDLDQLGNVGQDGVGAVRGITGNPVGPGGSDTTDAEGESFTRAQRYTEFMHTYYFSDTRALSLLEKSQLAGLVTLDATSLSAALPIILEKLGLPADTTDPELLEQALDDRLDDIMSPSLELMLSKPKQGLEPEYVQLMMDEFLRGALTFDEITDLLLDPDLVLTESSNGLLRGLSLVENANAAPEGWPTEIPSDPALWPAGTRPSTFAIPEPASALLLTALVGPALLRRRR